jgi:hypothetical protein
MADTDIRNDIHSTTLDTAQYGAGEDEGNGGEDSRHASAEEGNIDVVKSLLERGININGRNERTPSDEIDYTERRTRGTLVLYCTDPSRFSAR